MRTGQCFLLVYSITDRQSFTEAEAMYNFTTRIKDTDKVPAVSTLQVTFIILLVTI